MLVRKQSQTILIIRKHRNIATAALSHYCFDYVYVYVYSLYVCIYR